MGRWRNQAGKSHMTLNGAAHVTYSKFFRPQNLSCVSKCLGLHENRGFYLKQVNHLCNTCSGVKSQRKVEKPFLLLAGNGEISKWDPLSMCNTDISEQNESCLVIWWEIFEILKRPYSAFITSSSVFSV